MTLTQDMIVKDPLPRFPPDVVARVRASCLSRWLVRITTFGECVIPQDREPFGRQSPAVFVTGPDIGPSLAQSCAGAPVNYCYRTHDRLRCHWTPAPGEHLLGVQPAVACGVVERAWCDVSGILGVVDLFRDNAHDDLEALDSTGALGWAGLCLVTADSTDVVTTPWGLDVAHVRASRAVSLDFVSLPFRPGARVLRRLGRDEDPDERADPSESLTIVPSFYSISPTLGRPAEATVAAGIASQTIGEGNLGAGSVTTPKRQVLGSISGIFLNILGATMAGPTTVNHNLGVVPITTHDSSHAVIFSNVSNITSTQFDISAFNVSGSTTSATITIHVM